MSPALEMLGPIEAIDGVLMFGVSTAMIVTVIQRVILHVPFGHSRLTRPSHGPV